MFRERNAVALFLPFHIACSMHYLIYHFSRKKKKQFETELVLAMCSHDMYRTVFRNSLKKVANEKLTIQGYCIRFDSVWLRWIVERKFAYRLLSKMTAFCMHDYIQTCVAKHIYFYLVRLLFQALGNYFAIIPFKI